MAWIRRLVAGVALVCAVAGAFAASVAWTDFDESVVNKLVQECAASYRVKEFTEENGRVPLVVLGEVRNNTGEDIDMSIFIAHLQDALINSRGVLEFVAGGDQRQALRAEKQDQDYHASMESAKTIDNETAADFMLVGDLNLLEVKSKKLSCQLVIQLCGIETNRIVFSSVKDVTIKGVKIKGAKQERHRGTLASTIRESSGNWDTYKVFSAAVPVVRRGFDGDGGDAECEYHAVTVGFDKSYFHVHYPSHITLMTKYGISIGGGTMSADYGMGDEAELSGIVDFMTYARYGAGFAINLGGIVVIPTAGVGMTLDGLMANEDAGTVSAKEYEGCDATVDGFVNVLVALMFSDNWGLGLSLEVSANLCGAGAFTELEGYAYGYNFDMLSVTPTIGICYRP